MLVGISIIGIYYLVKSLKFGFPLMSSPKTYVHIYIIIDFPMTYVVASVLCQSDCAFLDKTVNTAVFFVKSNENTYPKGRTLIQMYRVIPQTKIRNS